MLDNIPSGDEDDQEEELGTTEDSDDGDSVDSDSEESEDVESEDPYYDPFGDVRRCIRCSLGGGQQPLPIYRVSSKVQTRL